MVGVSVPVLDHLLPPPPPASRPPPANMRPGSPAPAMGPGTATPVSEKLALNGPW